MNAIPKLILTSILALLTCSAAQAQKGRPAAASMPAATDSLTKVYTYVQYMPLYKGKEGTDLLTKDLQREFQAASTAAGCTAPPFPIVVSITVGPSGVIQDVVSVNNMPLITAEELAAGKRGVVGTRSDLQTLPDACEAALGTAGRKLPRLNPGSINGRRVTMSYTLKLAGTNE